jgi:uncharacterized protein
MTQPNQGLPSGIPPAALSRLRRIVLGAAGAFLLVTIVLPWLASFATDWLWFQEIHFEPVFLTSLAWRFTLFLVGGVVAFGFLYGNIRLARRESSALPALFLGRVDGPPIDVLRIVPRVLFYVAIVIAFFFAVTNSALWMTFLQFLHGVPVGVRDPVFGRDIGYYLFRLPAISAVLNMLVGLTTLSLIGVAILYALHGDLSLPPRRMSATPPAARHLGALVALFFVLLAFRLWLVGAPNLLSSTTGPLVGANYTDVHITLPAIRLSALVGLIAAALVVYGVFQRKLVWYAVMASVLYAAVGIVGRGVVPFLVQKLVVAPNELSREMPYLVNHITATRAAWGLERVETHDLNGNIQLSMADIRANGPTIDNVRLWERDLLQQTFGQLQEIRTYYDFVSVFDDRYMVDGRYRQVHVAARELNTASLPTRTFINERLTFTHGMGITMAPVNQVTSEGLPVLFIKDLPPVSTISIKLTRPQIYYGQLTNSYVFVGTKQREFDYPAGDQNVYTTYSGRGGIPVGSLMRRALYAWQLGSLKILLSNDITGAARILFRRNIADRASTALPFLTFDAEPYLVVSDAGELKWILDAYTTNANYPYAQRTSDGTSYMRNSVKVVIDAYDGTVDAYIADATDPVLKTYTRIFGGIFKPLSAMPADLRRHIRYPGDLFRIQTALHAGYHMVQPETFYHREDQWQIPGLSDSGRNVTPFMRHIILRLPGEPTPEFIYMTPFTPQGKDNLAAWMVARMDGDNYGKLVVYRFPRQTLVFGPKQVVGRINQDTEISRQISLWDRAGSKVIRGELLVIPIEQSLIYVQPLYLQGEGGTIPELKRVVVTHEDRVVMAETLEEGLGVLFAGASPRPATVADTLGVAPPSAPAPIEATGGAAPSAAVADLLRQAQEHYDRAIAAQRAGNWAEYGKEIDALGAVIKRLRAGSR